MLFGAIEAGGTKFVCAVGDDKGNLLERTVIPTRKPPETMKDVFSFFKSFTLESIGVGAFGPINLNTKSSSYGIIQNTTKISWKQFDLLGCIKKEFNIPVKIDTDVNAAALGEFKAGAAAGDYESCLYVTIGTGIGAGAVNKGEILHGVTHPEMGHILLNRHPDDNYDGICSYHENCFEGLASGPAIESRWGEKGAVLKEKEEVWEIEAYYIAQALMNYILILSPEVIILGGGVMNQKQLLPMINQRLKTLLDNYIDDDQFLITTPTLGGEAGIKGALLLAYQESTTLMRR